MKKFLALLLLLPLMAALPASALRAQEQATLTAGRQVYVLANDNAIIPGLLEGFDGGYLVLRLPDKLLRFSPKDFRAVFLTEEAAREGLKKFLEHGTTPGDKSPEKTPASITPAATPENQPPAAKDESAADKDFRQALEQAKAKVAQLTPAQRLVGPETVFLEAQNCLLEPQALLEPLKAVPVFQACLMAVRPRQKERAEELLRRYMRNVGSSALSAPQKEQIREQVKKLYQIIAGARD